MATTMNKGMSPVICPYCRAIMQSVVRPSTRFDSDVFGAVFVCSNCGAQTPPVWSTDKEGAEWQAWDAAMKTAPEEYDRKRNQVLTWDDLTLFNSIGQAIPCEIRGELHEIAWMANVLVPAEEVIKDEETLRLCRARRKPDVMGIKHNRPNQKTYGITWRGWLYPPTVQEMESEPWRGQVGWTR